jgi:hypothetical protein
VAIHLRTLRAASLVTGLALIASLGLPASSATTPPPMRLLIDGKVVQTDPAMRVETGRILLPLRAFVERLGVEPIWDGTERSVTIQSPDRYVKVWLDRQLACLSPNCDQAALMDVPARAWDGRTFLPIRFLANALGASVTWDQGSQTATVTTRQGAHVAPSPVKITSLQPGAVISGPVQLQATGASGTWVQFYLIDTTTRTGPMIGTGADPAASYTYLPDPAHNGKKLLLAGIRGADGQMRYSDPVPVTVQVNPTVTLEGIAADGRITGPQPLLTNLNFVATKQEFRLINPTTGESTVLGSSDPYDHEKPFVWYPGLWHNGTWQLQAVAWDRFDNEYRSAPLTVQVETGRRFYLNGITAGQTLTTGTVHLSTGANFGTSTVQYLVDGQVIGSGASFTWQYDARWNGAHTIQAVFTGTDGTVVRTEPVSFTVAWQPYLKATGVSPKAIITSDGVTLGAQSNLPLRSVTYRITSASGTVTGGTKAGGEGLKWVPSSGGSYTLSVTAVTQDGTTLTAEPIPFKAYTGPLYTKRALTTKEAYLELIKGLAPKQYREIGMSSAIQVAQSILETGWGQSIPVDKYTGQFSYALFGIKGSGTAGSVTITTWEVYNGVSVTIDDQFRAYHSVQESWDDHAAFLMGRPWYAPFRAVMADPIQGAYAIRRSGYATDPNYPGKLINIMKQNNLFALDEIQW